MGAGRVILLNGTSSSGKTTIIDALHPMMPGPCLRTGIDDFLDGLGRRWIEVSEHPAPPHPAQGWLAVVREGRLIEVRTGLLGQRLLAALYASVAAMTRSGVDVLVDDVIHERATLETAVEQLDGVPVTFVGVRCPVEVAEQRERARGDRLPGGARAFHETVHAYVRYDFEVNSGERTAQECAAAILAYIEAHPSRDLSSMSER